MPAGESWVGVYYNPVYGYLHMVEQDGNIVGRWKRTDSSHWGELSGTVEGNVMHFTWKEHNTAASVRAPTQGLRRLRLQDGREHAGARRAVRARRLEQRRRLALREAAQREARPQLDQRRQPDRRTDGRRQVAVTPAPRAASRPGVRPTRPSSGRWAACSCRSFARAPRCWCCGPFAGGETSRGSESSSRSSWCTTSGCSTRRRESRSTSPRGRASTPRRARAPQGRRAARRLPLADPRESREPGRARRRGG